MNRICGAFLIAFLTLSICGVAFAKDKCKLGFSPDPMPFDFVEVGQSKTLTVTVTNEGTNSVDITAVGGVEPPFSIASSTCSGVLGPGATCQVMITFSPTVKGAKRDKVHFFMTGCPKDTLKIGGVGVKTPATPTPTATATPTATPTSTGSATPTATPTPGPALWVTITGSVSGSGGTVAAYSIPLSANANTPPAGTFTSDALSAVAGIAVDAGGNIYVSNGMTSSIEAFAPASSGVATPIREIAGDATTLLFPSLMTLDSVPNIYVGNPAGGMCGGAVTVFPASGNGNIAPSASIVCASVADDKTGFVQPHGVARDSHGNIYAVNQNSPSITVYASGSNGNVAPTTTIAGGNRLCTDVNTPFPCCEGGQIGTCFDLTQLGSPYGIAMDSKDNFYVTNEGGPPGALGSSVTIYQALGGSGGIENDSPLATIAGSNTQLNVPLGIALDSSGNIYVANSQAGETSNITVYSPLGGSKGTLNEAPIATINTAPFVPGSPSGLAIGEFTPAP